MVWLRLVALALTALILIPAGAHLFELPAKVRLDRDAYFTVQQIYAGWALFAVPILMAFVANAALFLAERRRGALGPGAGALVAALLIVASLVIFFVWVFPANQATANWTVMPGNWEQLRRDWEYGHAVNAVVLFLALIATAWTVATGDARARPRPGGP